MKVRIIHYEKGTVFEGDVEAVYFPSEAGDTGVLPGHAEYYALLSSGAVKVYGKESLELEINRGTVAVKSDSVVMLIR